MGVTLETKCAINSCQRRQKFMCCLIHSFHDRSRLTYDTLATRQSASVIKVGLPSIQSKSHHQVMWYTYRGIKVCRDIPYTYCMWQNIADTAFVTY